MFIIPCTIFMALNDDQEGMLKSSDALNQTESRTRMDEMEKEDKKSLLQATVHFHYSDSDLCLLSTNTVCFSPSVL